MNIFYMSIGITVVSNILYHITQKNISSNANPLISLIVTYFVALIASLVVYLVYPSNHDLLTSIKTLNGASFALGIIILGVEMGYLLVYRSGGHLNLTAITITLLVTILLVPVGMIFFHEKISIQQIIGALLGIGSLILLSPK